MTPAASGATGRSARSASSPAAGTSTPGPALLMLLVAALTALPACGGTGDDRPAARPGDSAATIGSEGDTATLDHGALDAVGLDTAGLDTAGLDTAGSAADAGADGWERSERAVETGGYGVLTAVRTGRHDGWDRVVFEFEGELPGYQVRYPTDPLMQCGSGQPILVGEPHTVQIVLRYAAAHDDAGQVTVEDRRRTPALPVLRTARLTCDFEGVVEWVLGVEARSGFRVLALEQPTRLVVDLRHQP